MTRLRTYIYALILACAVGAGPAAPAASADHGKAYESATLSRYLQIAQAQWGGVAPTCTGRRGEAIPVHAVLVNERDPHISAIAEQPGCRIWLDRDFWPASPDEVDCVIIAHEWGHLLGHGHVEGEHNLMYGTPESGAPGCGVFGAPVVAPVIPVSGRRPARRAGPKRGTRRRAVKHRTVSRPCARRSKPRRAGARNRAAHGCKRRVRVRR